MPATLADAIPSAAKVLGMKQTDARVIDYVNEAIQRLLPKGKWVGTTARMKFCTYNRCITFPRQVEAVEAYTADDIPGTITNDWYEFLPTGPGRITCSDGWSDILISRGFAPAFDDIRTTGNKLWVRSDQVETTGLQIRLLGYDKNGNWVRTSQAGAMADGELVDITGAGAITVTEWRSGGLTAVLKPVTAGYVSIWEVDATTGALRQLANYESDETQPRYRRYFLPDVPSGTTTVASCCNNTNTTDAVCVEAMVKLAYIPAVNTTDILLIGNVPALKDMVQSIRFAENNLLPAAAAYEAKAIKCLDDELSAYLGDGPVINLKFEHRDTFGAGDWSTYWP